MKLAIYAVCAIAMIMGGVSCTTEGGRSAAATVVAVQFVDPGRFTDFSVQGRDVRYSTSVFAQEVVRTLTPVMESRFSGYLLTLRFTDIDLAGHRSSVGASSVRIVRSQTPARLSFEYVLRDKSGSTVARGSQRLVDDARRTLSSNPGRSRSLSTESRMLQRWLQSLSVTR
jgi:Protein of unknown function (DUF3016)